VEKELKTNNSQVIVVMARAAPNLIHMLLSLFTTYLTLGRQVRRARNAFERQLLLQGMSKHDAERLSACYQELKENILAAVKKGLSIGL
jgi:hypothetical protein